MKKIFNKLNLLLVFALLLATTFFSTSLFNNTSKAFSTTTASSNSNIINSFQGVADYLHKYKHLPSNYITKAEASKLGWTPGKDLSDYAPGKSIGGDAFMNSEKKLPVASGRTWHECDINYNDGQRGADRIVYSNDGLVYGTSDHYETFKCYYK